MGLGGFENPSKKVESSKGESSKGERASIPSNNSKEENSFGKPGELPVLPKKTPKKTFGGLTSSPSMFSLPPVDTFPPRDPLPLEDPFNVSHTQRSRPGDSGLQRLSGAEMKIPELSQVSLREQIAVLSSILESQDGTHEGNPLWSDDVRDKFSETDYKEIDGRIDSLRNKINHSFGLIERYMDPTAGIDVNTQKALSEMGQLLSTCFGSIMKRYLIGLMNAKNALKGDASNTLRPEYIMNFEDLDVHFRRIDEISAITYKLNGDRNLIKLYQYLGRINRELATEYENSKEFFDKIQSASKEHFDLFRDPDPDGSTGGNG